MLTDEQMKRWVFAIRDSSVEKVQSWIPDLSEHARHNPQHNYLLGCCALKTAGGDLTPYIDDVTLSKEERLQKDLEERTKYTTSESIRRAVRERLSSDA